MFALDERVYMPHCLGMDAREAILAKVERYLAASGLTAHQFGMQAVRNHKLVSRLRGGNGVTLTTVERVEAFIRDNPPPASTNRAA